MSCLGRPCVKSDDDDDDDDDDGGAATCLTWVLDASKASLSLKHTKQRSILANNAGVASRRRREPQAEILKHRTLSPNAHTFPNFLTVARREQGQHGPPGNDTAGASSTSCTP